MTVDTSSFLTKTGLAQTTGTATNNTMSQEAITTALGNKQDTLVSGNNIKTLNNESILGSGNINIESENNYLGKTSLYATEADAINLNNLSIGKYYLKHDSSNDSIWIKATYKGSGATATTKTKKITLFSNLSSSRVILNTIVLYIDKEFDEETTTLSSIGSITTTFLDYTRALSNNYRSISLNNTSISVGSTYEDFYLGQPYSTSEKRVGTFVNGKPLYERTGTITFSQSDISSSAGHVRGTYLGDNLEYVSLYEVFHSVNAGMPFYNSYNNTFQNNFYVENGSNDNKGYIMGYSRASWCVGLPFYITVRYTKTTDSVGS